MRIPHNFSINPVSAPKVRRVNDKTMEANAVIEQANQGLIKGVNAAVQTGNEIYQDHIGKQYQTDMIAGGAMLDELKIKRDDAISRIPVDSSVDYAKEVKRINDDYNTQWSGWSSKNIRNIDHPAVREMRQRSIDAFESDGAVSSARLGVQYENARNTSKLDFNESVSLRAIAEDPFNSGALDAVLRNEDARVETGDQTVGQAAKRKEEIRTSTDKLRDQQSVIIAKNLMAAGDKEAAEKAINGMTSLTSDADKKKILNATLKDGTYSRFISKALEIDTFSGWEEYKEEVKSDTSLDGQHKRFLLSRQVSGVNALNKNLENEASVLANSGDFAGALTKVSEMHGLKSGERKLMEQKLESSRDSFQIGQSIEATGGAFELEAISESIDGIETMTISDKAASKSDANRKLNAIRSGQSFNRSEFLKSAAKGQADRMTLSKALASSTDDTVNGFGLEYGEAIYAMGVAASQEFANAENAERIMDEIATTDEWKDAEDALALGYINPSTFDMREFSKGIVDSGMNPMAQADLLSRAFEINTATSAGQLEDTRGWNRDISQSERDFRSSVNAAYKEILDLSPSMANGLGRSYGNVDKMITKEAKKKDPDWQALFKKIQSENVIKAITQ